MIRPSRATSQPATDPRPALVPAGRFDAQPPFYLDRPVTLIGSRHRAHVRLESDEVSRSHAIVVNTQGRVFIRDLGSRTRVYVNGRETWETQLADGDYVTIGHFSFRFSAGDTSRSARPVNGAAAAMLTGTTLAAGGVALDRAVCVIGCRQGADLLLRGSAVSFAHAVIVRHEAGHLVRDLGSRTGTYLNGAAIEGDAELLPGCVLRVGPYEMKYATAAAGAAAAPTAPPPDTVAAAPRYWDTTTYAGVLGDHADDSGTLTPAAAEPTPAAAAPVADSIPVAPDPVTPVAPEAVPAEPVAAEAAPAEAELPPEMDGVAELEAWAASAGDTPAFVEPVPPAQPPAPAKAPAAEAAKPRRPRKKPAKKTQARPKAARAEQAPSAEWPETEVAPAPVIATPRPEPVTVVLPPAPPEADPFAVFTTFAPTDFSFLDAPAAPEPVQAPAAKAAPERQPPATVPADTHPPRVEETPAEPALEPEPLPPALASAPLVAEPVFETPTSDAPVIPTAEAPTPAAPEADVFDQLDVLLPEPFGPEPPTTTAQAADVGSPVAPEPGTAAGAPGGGEFDLVAPAEAVVAAAPVAAVPPQPAPPTRPIPASLPAARAHHRHEPSAPPPPEWGVLAAAIAISESPLDGPTPAPVATEGGVAGARPARRFSRLKWFTVVAVLLAGGAAAAVAVFGPANLLKFLH